MEIFLLSPPLRTLLSWSSASGYAGASSSATKKPGPTTRPLRLPTVATKASHYFSLNHPPVCGSCTSYNPPYLHPRSASIGILIVILAVYHGVVVPQARLNFYFFPTSTAAKKTCHFVSRLWKTFKAGNCLNAQAWLTLVDGLWVSLGRNEWDQNLSFVL